jgi:predicted alpha/beta-fold hydrolase
MNYYIGNSSWYSLYCFLMFSLVANFQKLYSSLYSMFTKVIDYPKIYSVNSPNFTIDPFVPKSSAIFGYVQTTMQTKTNFSRQIYRTTFLNVSDDSVIALDWRESSEMNEETGIIVCLHGLGGNSSALYISNFVEYCILNGYRVVVYNRRGHGKSTMGAKFPKHSNMEDMEIVTNHIHKSYPSAKMFLVGFSCGGNLAINYVAKYCKPYEACVSICNGYNIYEGTKILQDKNSICAGVVASFLQDVLHDNKCYIDESVYKIGAQCKNVVDFERHVVVPNYEYKTIEDYYEDDSCHNNLLDVKIPLLCICSEDDPFVDKSMIEFPKKASCLNSNIITVVTKYGGHIGWIEDLNSIPWHTKTIFRFLQKKN